MIAERIKHFQNLDGDTCTSWASTTSSAFRWRSSSPQGCDAKPSFLRAQFLAASSFFRKVIPGGQVSPRTAYSHCLAAACGRDSAAGSRSHRAGLNLSRRVGGVEFFQLSWIEIVLSRSRAKRRYLDRLSQEEPVDFFARRIGLADRRYPPDAMGGRHGRTDGPL